MGDPLHGQFANRPDYGVANNKNPVPLWANYFKMSFLDPDLVLHIYDMSFEAFPPKNFEDSAQSNRVLNVPEGKKLVQVIRCALRTSKFEHVRSKIATDFSKMLISSKRLGSDEMQTGVFSFVAENEDKPHTGTGRFQMTLKQTREVCLSDLLDDLASNVQEREAHEDSFFIVQALDIVLGHQRKMSSDYATPKQGKCFPLRPSPAQTFVLRGPRYNVSYLKGVRGFFASVRTTTNSPLVNCNACCGAFYKDGPLQDLVSMFTRGPNTTTEDYKRLENAIEGLRVELTHLKDQNDKPIRPIRTIFGLARPYGGPNVVTFTHHGDNRIYTVEEYWRTKKYGSSGSNTQPVINVGNKHKPILVPTNVCRIIPGQMAKKKLDSTQIQDMIENARRDPEPIRTSIINDAFGVLGLEKNPTLESFGISVTHEMVDVPGRVLKSPTVTYAKRVTTEVGPTSRWNLNGKTVVKPMLLEKWGILRFDRDSNVSPIDQDRFESACKGFYKTLQATFGKGNIFPNSWFDRCIRGDDIALENAFKSCLNSGIILLVVVLLDNDASTYKQIKKLGDVDYGIRTVCVLSEDRKMGQNSDKNINKKFYKASAAYFANVALKINLKLGGNNHTLESLNPIYKTTMVIGIDVTHPSPGPTKRTAPSVAAMVASSDESLAQWPVDLRINTAGKEMVDLLGPMLKTRLEHWLNTHGDRLPENLLIYRDGVSESQYKAVLEKELRALQDTCEVMYGARSKQQPKITLIIVGKRHHTRFFKKVNEDLSTNPDYGTIVDTTVTEARHWDFFLQSHHALLGTARPAHYFVLCNEIFTKQFVGPNIGISDYLHKLTYEMCWLFGRSTGPVSIPPPVYYADLACERSRCYGDFDDISDTSSMTGFDGGNSQGRGSGYQAVGRPGPSNQGSSTPGSSKQTPSKQGSSSTSSSSKDQLRPSQLALPNQMAGLTKKEKNRLFEEKMAASKKAAAGGSSSKVEGKKPDPKADAKADAKVEGKKPEPKSASKGEGKKLESKPESKGQGKKAESKPESKPEGKGKGKAETKLPDRGGSGPSKAGNEKAKEETQSKAQGKKPEPRVEAPKEETPRPKEKDEVLIHSNLMNTMFYV